MTTGIKRAAPIPKPIEAPIDIPNPFLDFGTFMLRPGDFIRLYPNPLASEIQNEM